MSRAPLIAVSPNDLVPADRHFHGGKALEYGEAHMASSVARGGGIPLMVYRAEHEGLALTDWALAIMERVDALLLSGGDDIAPALYGEAAQDPAWQGNPLRDAFELALYRAALVAHKPVLGVCRGAQLIAVAEGGSLWQELATRRPHCLVHRSQEAYDRFGHDLRIEAGAPWLAALFDGEEATVNSVHHQGICREPANLRVLGRAPDGLAECFVRADAWVLGVQWHPEWMQDRASQRRLFTRFVEAAGRPLEIPW